MDECGRVCAARGGVVMDIRVWTSAHGRRRERKRERKEGMMPYHFELPSLPPSPTLQS